MGGEYSVFYTSLKTKKILKYEEVPFNGISLEISKYHTIKRALQESLDKVIDDYPHNVKSILNNF